jgi:hypothetical protein
MNRVAWLAALLFALPAAGLAAPAPARKPLFLVTDAPYEMWQGAATKIHVVAYGPGFQPIAGARVFAGDAEVGTTGPGGTLIFSHRPRGAFLLRAVAQIDGVEAEGAVRMESYRRTESFETANLFVHTDRGVYRPGEEVLLRAIAWRLRGDFTPIAAAKVEALLKAPDAGWRAAAS